ncbi:MAG: hypothetical protein ABI664_09060 [bacterium]
MTTRAWHSPGSTSRWTWSSSKVTSAAPPAALVSRMPARMIHEDAAHRDRGHGKEVRPSLPIEVVVADEVEVGLVYERGGVEGVS